MAVVSQEHVRTELAALSHRGLDLDRFAQAAVRILGRRIGFDGACVITLDPATMLPTSEVVADALPATAAERLAEMEISRPDFNKFRALAHSPSPAASLSAATERRLDRSPRHRELKAPHGFEDELRATLVDDAGAWGALTLLRAKGATHFKDADSQLLASTAPYLAEGLRRTLLHEALGAGPDDAEVGLVVLADDDTVELANPAAEAWIEEMLAGRERRLPPAVRAVAVRARVSALAETDISARARVRTSAGRWLLVRGSVLGDGDDARTAIVIEPAGASELAPLIADAYGLTERERSVTQLVAHGLSTKVIAARLHLSEYTVQDHLKAIFTKVGVNTRGELVARLFVDHYAPRLAGGERPGRTGWFAGGAADYPGAAG